jgi:hypothetical protein
MPIWSRRQAIHKGIRVVHGSPKKCARAPVVKHGRPSRGGDGDGGTCSYKCNAQYIARSAQSMGSYAAINVPDF